MATQQQQQQRRHWYNDREMFLHGFVRSNYITAFTDWFMGLTGKATEIVLYATVLYSSAQLYPGVHLPAGLSLAVFLIQMGALDVGGLALGKLAKQARADGNTAGADEAARLSQWLIGIMLAGVVTVGLEHALPFTLPDVVTVSIDVVLVVARSICAVLYGRAVHNLKTDSAAHQADELSQTLSEKFSHELTTALHQLRQEFSHQASELSQVFSNQFSELSQQLTRSLENQGGQVAAIQDAIAAHEQVLTGLAALPSIIDRHEHATRQALAGMRASIESSAASKPKLSLVASPVNTEKLTTDEGELTNRQFIEDHLSKHPEARNVDVIEAGSKHGLTLSQSQVSQIRKALKELSA
jgi:hypothetical protein